MGIVGLIFVVLWVSEKHFPADKIGTLVAIFLFYSLVMGVSAWQNEKFPKVVQVTPRDNTGSAGPSEATNYRRLAVKWAQTCVMYALLFGGLYLVAWAVKGHPFWNPR